MARQVWISAVVLLCSFLISADGQGFEGKFYSGKGDCEYLKLLDTARRMFEPDPQYQNIAMLYTPKWDGFVEGPTWKSWWIQNSYGTTYCALPFYLEPYITWLQHSQDNWFKVQGDGKSEYGYKKFRWIPPDGHLVDCASPGISIHKQGDGNVAIHDWPVEFAAAGLLMQSELLLISRDQGAISKYLGNLERAANFIETRRDPNNNLFLAGPASNLLAPSYAGYKKPDGTYGMAYLAGISITYIAALDRLIEVEKLAGRNVQAKLYDLRRQQARQGLRQLMTNEGYFIRSLDPDGTKHGVYGAQKHGYFEASPNHDAICFRVADENQAHKIYDKIVSIPIRPHGLIIANYPSYDDMYYDQTKPAWEFGTWVNGGHWSTCEARMIIGYMRLGKYEDARRSMKAIMSFADEFRLDNPLKNFGSEVFQGKKPVNLTYDALGIPAAMIRGLFEYVYSAEGLVLYPHIPSGITEMQQKFPIRFGSKRIYISTAGNGAVRDVRINGKTWTDFDANSVRLTYSDLPATAIIVIALGQGRIDDARSFVPEDIAAVPKADDNFWNFAWIPQALADANSTADLKSAAEKIKRAYLASDLKGVSREHARVAAEALAAIYQRQNMLQSGNLTALKPAIRQQAANAMYVDTAIKLSELIHDR